jgi:hypothetical protein
MDSGDSLRSHRGILCDPHKHKVVSAMALVFVLVGCFVLIRLLVWWNDGRIVPANPKTMAVATPDLIEYLPRKKGGSAGRFVKLSAVIVLLFGGFAYWRLSHGVDGGDISSALLISTPAWIFGGLGLLTAIVCWLRTGRPW